MHIDEQTGPMIDRAAATGSAVGVTTWGLAEVANIANSLIPIATLLVLGLTAIWYLWRMVDRVRFGPSKRRDDDG